MAAGGSAALGGERRTRRILAAAARSAALGGGRPEAARYGRAVLRRICDGGCGDALQQGGGEKCPTWPPQSSSTPLLSPPTHPFCWRSCSAAMQSPPATPQHPRLPEPRLSDVCLPVHPPRRPHLPGIGCPTGQSGPDQLICSLDGLLFNNCFIICLGFEFSLK